MQTLWFFVHAERAEPNGSHAAKVTVPDVSGGSRETVKLSAQLASGEDKDRTTQAMVDAVYAHIQFVDADSSHTSAVSLVFVTSFE